MKTLRFSFYQPTLLASAALTTSIAFLPAPSDAFSLIRDRAALEATDQIDWGSLGPIPSPAPFAVLPDTFSATSVGGLEVGVTIPPTSDPAITPPLLFQTTATGTPTNFAAGDFILFTGLLPGQFPATGNPGPLTLLFETPVAGVGAQFAVHDTPLFTAFITAFDSQNTLLGSFSVPGTASTTLDNSAIFLGVLDDTPSIAKVVFSSSVPDRAFGINTLSINSSDAVPEPSSIVALGLAGFGLLSAQKQRRKNAHRPSGLE